MSLTIDSPHFSEDELRCKCGECEYTGMNVEFMEKLERLRVLVNKPIYLSSAYRCPAHNNKESSTGLNGPHTTHKAVDIRCYGNLSHEVLESAMVLGFTGIGISQKGNHGSRFIHIDAIEGETRPWVWSY